MTKSQEVAAAFVRGWTRIYTWGLAAEVRQERLDEITSDLWEQSNASTEIGNRPASSAVEMTFRLVLGFPADVAWRMEAGTGSRARRERGMNASFLGMRVANGGRWDKAFLACVGLLALYQAAVVFAGVGFVLGFWGGGEEDAGQGWYLTLPPSAVGILLIWAGLRTRTNAPFKGGVLIALGVLPSILMFWMMLPPVVALGVVIYALVHGRGEQQRIDAGV
jgi:hypothetical protein